ncbi:uncharacterized protein [Parasteatoda tepidariorum]|uniref:uncharacterized protein n=1 Tax=Parasteatoda tepidariorum TaxID=114398 RepID=UPI0039BCCCC5
MNIPEKKSKENFKIWRTSTPNSKTSITQTFPVLERISSLRQPTSDFASKNSLNHLKRIKKKNKRMEKKSTTIVKDKFCEDIEISFSSLSIDANPKVTYSTPVRPRLFKPKKVYERQKIFNRCNFDSKYDSSFLQKNCISFLNPEQDSRVKSAYFKDLNEVKVISKLNSFGNEELTSSVEHGMVKELHSKRVSLLGKRNKKLPYNKIALEQSKGGRIISAGVSCGTSEIKKSSTGNCFRKVSKTGKKLNELKIDDTESRVSAEDGKNSDRTSYGTFGRKKNIKENDFELNRESCKNTFEKETENEFEIDDSISEMSKEDGIICAGTSFATSEIGKSCTENGSKKLTNKSGKKLNELKIDDTESRVSTEDEKNGSGTSYDTVEMGKRNKQNDFKLNSKRESGRKAFAEETENKWNEFEIDDPILEPSNKDEAVSPGASEIRKSSTENGFESNVGRQSCKKAFQEEIIKIGNKLNECEIDDISSGMYGGNLNLDSSSKYKSLERNRSHVSQAFPVCISIPKSHSCSEAMQSLKIALDDLCIKYIDGRQSLQRLETKKVKTNTKVADHKIAKNFNVTVDDKEKRNRNNGNKAVKNKAFDKVKKSDRFSKNSYSKNASASISKEEKLDIINDFRNAWESSDIITDFASKELPKEHESTENVKKSKSGSYLIDSLGAISENFSKTGETINKTRINKSKEDSFKIPRVGKKRKTVAKGKENKGNKTQDKCLQKISKANDSNTREDSFTYPYSSTPFASPEIESRTMPSIFRGLSPVIEENTAKRESEKFSEPSVLYNSHTFSKKEMALRSSKEDRLWSSAFGHHLTASDYTCFSQFNSCSSDSEQTSKESNKSIFQSPVYRSPVISTRGCQRRACKDINSMEENSVKSLNGIYGKEIENKKNEFESDAVRQGISIQSLKSEIQILTDLSDPFEEVSNWELCIEKVRKQ